MHKVLTYVEYRAVSGVFQNIDPQPPLHPASVSSPRTKGGGVLTRRAVRGWGVNILEDARYWIGLLQYNPSMIVCICNTEEHAGCKLAWSGKSVIYSPANHWKAFIMSPNRGRGERYRARYRKERWWDTSGQRVWVWPVVCIGNERCEGSTEAEFMQRFCVRVLSPNM